ncbi:MAG TPA: hypothetical protein VHQ23_08920 [Ilumatobacteraceae bacterium]|jgi:hypothetical protein|nr:hypothetical protein [Ilumatobacteraceae bacterium]
MRRRSRRRPKGDDTGAALILAVGFVLMVGSISGGLAGLALTSLNNRNTLETLRNREYAADAAIESAISQVRGLTCASPSGSRTDNTVNGIDVRVDWVNACGAVQIADGSVVSQRNVIFAACLSTGSPCSDTAVPAVPVIIRAQVNFQQTLGGAVTKTYVQSWSVNR